MPNNCFSQIYVFGTRRTLVFFIFMRSAGAEQLFFSFSLVRHLPNEHFSCFWLFGGCRTHDFPLHNYFFMKVQPIQLLIIRSKISY